jgi:hypothetical protein
MIGKKTIVTGLLLLSGVLSAVAAQSGTTDQPQDSLTMSLCNNPEQIVARRVGDFRIEYYMGETQLNMKTMSGFLSLNSASAPWFKKFRARRLTGIGVVLGGIGLIVADGFISKPEFPIITIGGIATAIWGLTIYIGANDTFRLSVYHYNRNICRIK